MNNIIKKQDIGSFISLGTIIFTLISLIIYGVVLSKGDYLITAEGGDYFLKAEEFGGATATGIIAILLFAASFVLSQFKFDGLVGKVVGIVANAFRYIAPALLLYAALSFVAGTLTGLGWTFFSNEEMAVFPESVSVGKLAITAIVFFIISAIAGVVASFFRIVKEEEA